MLFFANIVLNFVLPFFILLRNDTKRKYGTMIVTAGIVLFGHWLDFFLMIKPGVLHTTHEAIAHAGGEAAHHSGFVAGYTLPGFLELGTMIGFLGLFLYFVFSRLEKAALVPQRDPYLMESLHHHV